MFISALLIKEMSDTTEGPLLIDAGFRTMRPKEERGGALIRTPTSEIRTSLVTDKRVYTNTCLSMLREEPRGQGKTSN